MASTWRPLDRSKKRVRGRRKHGGLGPEMDQLSKNYGLMEEILHQLIC